MHIEEGHIEKHVIYDLHFPNFFIETDFVNTSFVFYQSTM